MHTRRFLGALGLVVLLIGAAAASLFWGSNPLPAAVVWHTLTAPDQAEPTAAAVVLQGRVPRTVLVIVVGAALGVAGALIQALTRNPLADPGVLGINAGAALAVVGSVALFGRADIHFYLWFSFLGAALAAAGVYLLGGLAAATPLRLALAGVAISMAISSLVQLVITGNQNAFNEFRLWAAGSMENRGWPVVTAVLLPILIGLLVAVLVAPGLNALALGDEAGSALGVNVPRVRLLVIIAVTLLAGAATAAVGPIMFVGLGVPYLARAICGPDQRWVVPLAALAAPVVMLGADIFARLIVAPQEVQTGIITALIGGPVFIALVRRRRIEALS